MYKKEVSYHLQHGQQKINKVEGRGKEKKSEKRLIG